MLCPLSCLGTWALGLRASGLGFRGFRILDCILLRMEFRVLGLKFRVSGFRCCFKVLGFRALGLRGVSR